MAVGGDVGAAAVRLIAKTVSLATAAQAYSCHPAVGVRPAHRLKPDAVVDGVLVQPMIEGDVELVIGLQNDPVFGLVVMVGLGGIHIEVLKDVVFRKAPVTPTEAGRMLDELKSHAILHGVRGKAAISRDALTQMISTVSCFGVAAGSRLKELDLNPVLAGPHGVTAVDWLMVLN